MSHPMRVVVREMDSGMIYMGGMNRPSKYSVADVSRLGGILCT